MKLQRRELRVIMARWGVWFKGRNTPVVVTANTRSEAISKARRRKIRPKGSVPVVSARQLTSSERKSDRSGNWIRTRSDGKSPSKSSVGQGRGQGPPRKRKSK